MLSKLVEVSLRFRGIVVALACLLVGYGVYATWSARYDVYPEFAPPEVVVQTEAPGLSAEDVGAIADAGARGLACIRAVMSAADPEKEAYLLGQALAARPAAAAVTRPHQT